MTGRRRAAAVVCAAGAVVLLGGTFLPWLRSGTVTRTSYGASGILQRLLGVDGPAGALLSVWPFVGAGLAVCALIALFGARTWAAALSLLVTVPVAATSVAVLGAPARFGVAVVGYGPGVTGIGAALSALGSIVSIVTTVRAIRRTRPARNTR